LADNLHISFDDLALALGEVLLDEDAGDASEDGAGRLGELVWVFWCRLRFGAGFKVGRPLRLCFFWRRASLSGCLPCPRGSGVAWAFGDGSLDGEASSVSQPDSLAAIVSTDSTYLFTGQRVDSRGTGE
jgi:hypothetical protein